MKLSILRMTVIVATAILHTQAPVSASILEIHGVTVTPHMMVDTMRYQHAPEPAEGARVQLFIRNTAPQDAAPLVLNADTRLRFDGQTPAHLLDEKRWAWHDTPAAYPEGDLMLPPEALTVWTFNGRALPFGPGGGPAVEIGPEEAPWLKTTLTLDKPNHWLSAITFLGPESAIQPDTMAVHIANASDAPVTIQSCRLWLPENPGTPSVLFAREALEGLAAFNGHVVIPGCDRGGFSVTTGPLPLTYAAVEVVLSHADGSPFSLWAFLRIKPERFDISGGWVRPVERKPYLKTLKRLHINTAHIASRPGYTDTELYDRYPLKYFHKLTPFEVYDTDAMLPRIHAVEFLGEPQFGGGRPVPPQEVWEALRPYAATRLATTVTHSEERIWRDYAGLSDFPHYNAYRVTAPSADVWRDYDRWDGQRVGWGAPLETIGDMCRSLRELNRPMPCAIWSQGPHHGWGRYARRARTAPTPDEIRMQAYHALSTRITSLYWFNLSLKSLVQWRDTLDEVARLGREMRLLEDFMLEGDAYRFERLVSETGRLDWDIASVCGPRAALLFALDLDYTPDPDERVFIFGPPRDAAWSFVLPAYLHEIKDVFRMDADGLYDAHWSLENGAVAIQDKTSRVAVYVAAMDAGLRGELEEKRQRLITEEAELQFDPARNDQDFAALVELLEDE